MGSEIIIELIDNKVKIISKREVKIIEGNLKDRIEEVGKYIKGKKLEKRGREVVLIIESNLSTIKIEDQVYMNKRSMRKNFFYNVKKYFPVNRNEFIFDIKVLCKKSKENRVSMTYISKEEIEGLIKLLGEIKINIKKIILYEDLISGAVMGNKSSFAIFFNTKKNIYISEYLEGVCKYVKKINTENEKEVKYKLDLIIAEMEAEKIYTLNKSEKITEFLKRKEVEHENIDIDYLKQIKKVNTFNLLDDKSKKKLIVKRRVLKAYQILVVAIAVVELVGVSIKRNVKNMEVEKEEYYRDEDKRKEKYKDSTEVVKDIEEIKNRILKSNEGSEKYGGSKIYERDYKKIINALDEGSKVESIEIKEGLITIDIISETVKASEETIRELKRNFREVNILNIRETLKNKIMIQIEIK